MGTIQPRQSPFLEKVRTAIRIRHYSIRTEQTYVDWIVRFIRFHDCRHPKDMAEDEVAAFLSHLAMNLGVAASTQNQAFNALVFLYKAVIGRPLENVPGVARAKRPERLPVVLTPEEVRAVLRELDGAQWLCACLMYGSGLRVMETVRLRTKDLDFPHRAILVRDGKGGKDRVTTLPDELLVPLKRHSQSVKLLHEKDLSDGFGDVHLPYALSRKYPSAGRFVIPLPRICWRGAWTFARCRSSLVTSGHSIGDGYGLEISRRKRLTMRHPCVPGHRVTPT